MPNFEYLVNKFTFAKIMFNILNWAFALNFNNYCEFSSNFQDKNIFEPLKLLWENEYK